MLLKDNVDTADREHTTAGSFALLGCPSGPDAFLVQRLRAAGAVVLGKANLSEWANFRSLPSSSGWSGRGRPDQQPLRPGPQPVRLLSSGSGAGGRREPGARLPIGTETDGSIVCPSGQPTTTSGIKPTLGLVSRAGVVPISPQQDTAGPITRN